MASRSLRSFSERAKQHPHALTRKLFGIVEAKQSNLTLSADVATAAELLALADNVGPYISVLKTHIDILPDLTPATLTSLVALASKHNFLLFEDRKFIDIGSTVQKQYHGGTLRISEWADIVNCAVLAGEGIVQALEEVIFNNFGGEKGERGVLILAEMTTKGSLATGAFTEASVEIARKHPKSVIGFVAMRSFSDVETATPMADDEDFVVFTTGINLATKGDNLGQQYNTPEAAIQRGADLLIVGRGIYAAEDPVQSAKTYRDEAWKAYLKRIGE